MIEHIRKQVRNSLKEPLNRARLAAVAVPVPHAGDCQHTLPITPCALLLDKETLGTKLLLVSHKV